ncbi:MAG TPA: class I SAM-dependent methyltransferase [Blastocatellia bacterium]
MAFFSNRRGQFSYFAEQIGDFNWSGKSVLDFGGNIGNMLQDPNSTIEQERYWCLDIDKDAIEAGRAAFPKANWLIYDRYCFAFNPNGRRDLPLPRLGQKFDYVVAFSVFTNTTQTDMLDLVDQLEGMVSDNGTLAFTFIDPRHRLSSGQTNLEWRLELEKARGNISTTDVENIKRKTRAARWFMLVNGPGLYLESEDISPCKPDEEVSCYVYHTEDYMRTLFPRATVLPPVSNHLPHVNCRMQHCCVIKKG